MKTKLMLVLGVLLAMTAIHARANDNSYVVHEWGTFTSFQTADGALRSWAPLKSSDLPKFIYDWQNPGLDRLANMQMSKVALWSLQRMETPVIYFYSDKKMKVDVSVKFPKGRITEWYPQASRIGPALMTEAKHDLADDSRIEWNNLALMPEGFAKSSMPLDAPGTHYIAARETRSDVVTSEFGKKTGAPGENEKFLFYRGTGSFQTPLRVTMKSDDELTITNAGTEPLEHLFVLRVTGDIGKYVYVDKLPAGSTQTVLLRLNGDPGAVRNSEDAAVPLQKLSANLSKDMARSLEQTGLYKPEAEAMVKTWRDSWFSENGVRVLYILPRTWTDNTLPMTMKPVPKETVRVMVGRAEVFTPGMEQSLVSEMNKARGGDAGAAEHTQTMLKGMGRFAAPAYYRALETLNPKPSKEEQTKLWEILNTATTPPVAKQ